MAVTKHASVKAASTADNGGWAVRWLVVGVATLAIACVVTSVSWLAHSPTWNVSLATLLGAVLIALLLVPSRLVSLQFHVKEHRFAVDADEAVLLAGFVLLPPLLVVPAVMLGRAVVEAIRRHGTLKAVYNVSSHTVAAGVSCVVFLAALGYGMHPLLAAVLVPPTSALVAFFLLSCVLGLVSGQSPFRILLERFPAYIGFSVLLGVGLGISFVALFQTHPALTLTLSPLGALAWQTARTSNRQDRELETRRALADMAQRLVGCQDVELLADAALSTCLEVFDCQSAELVLEHGSRRTFRRVREVSGEARGPGGPLEVGISGVTNLRHGVIRIYPREGGRAFAGHDRAMGRTVAAAAAAALQTADILQDLEDAYSRLDTYLDASEDAILVVGADRNLRFQNECAKALLDAAGAGREDALATLLSGLDADPAAGAEIWEVRLKGPEGEDRIFETRSMPVRADAPEEDRLLLARDVTEQRRLENVEAEQREVLARNERLASLGTLVAGVAHEVNNPLMYMRGCAELLSMDLEFAKKDFEERGIEAPLDFGESLEQLERVLGGIRRLETIAKNLKSVAQGQRNTSGEVDMGAVAQRVGDLVGYGLPPDVHMSVIVNEGLPLIHGDAGALEQALLNLVKNAAEAMGGHRGEVAVRVSCADAVLHVVVADQGPGIHPDALGKLFTPFFTTKDEGTGLGLAFVHTVVQAHGGEVHVESGEGRGTTFTLRLPFAPLDDQAGGPSKREPASEAAATSESV